MLFFVRWVGGEVGTGGESSIKPVGKQKTKQEKENREVICSLIFIRDFWAVCRGWRWVDGRLDTVFVGVGRRFRGIQT